MTELNTLAYKKRVMGFEKKCVDIYAKFRNKHILSDFMGAHSVCVGGGAIRAHLL